MRKWDPKSEWKGQDAYIVGGGPSLRNFDWGLLRGHHTIGCNSAFLLGADIIKIIIFGDYVWWQNIGFKGTEAYGGIVVGCTPRFEPIKDECPWLVTMDRHELNGLGTKALGFAGNTGSLALNLALILGAHRVFLLGFDMKLGPDSKANWHDLRYETPDAWCYTRFIDEFQYVARDLPLVFPGREVWNVTDSSELPYFPKVGVAEHFKRNPYMEGIAS